MSAHAIPDRKPLFRPLLEEGMFWVHIRVHKLVPRHLISPEQQGLCCA